MMCKTKVELVSGEPRYPLNYGDVGYVDGYIMLEKIPDYHEGEQDEKELNAVVIFDEEIVTVPVKYLKVVK